MINMRNSFRRDYNLPYEELEENEEIIRELVRKHNLVTGS